MQAHLIQAQQEGAGREQEERDAPINHHPRHQFGLDQTLGRLLDVLGGKVGARIGPAEDDVAGGVAVCFDDCWDEVRVVRAPGGSEQEGEWRESV